MSKNAISILQEFGMRMGFMPIYVEILAQQGLLQNQFTIRVTCKNHFYDGRALNKKEAKRKAAEGMLQLLMNDGSIKDTTLLESNTTPFFQETKTTPPETTSSLSPNNIENYVGQLMELCVTNDLKQPVYNVIDVSGPPHNYQFKMSCAVGPIQEEALGKTKKLAKHYVSKKVLDNLMKTLKVTKVSKDTLPEDTLTQLGVKLMDIKIEGSNRTFDRLSDQALTSYRKMKKDIVNNGNTTILTYHLALSHICRSISHLYLEKCRNLKSSRENKVSEMKKIIGSMLNGVECESVNLALREGQKYMIGIRLTTVPVLFQIGVADSILEAEMQACYKILESILLFIE